MSGPCDYRQLEAPFQRHSDTSRAAAERAEERRPSQLRRVYMAILFAGREGLTDEEGTEVLHMNPSTYRPRRVELSRPKYDGEGKVIRPALVQEDGGRPTRSGRDAVVWVASAPELGWEHGLR